MWYIYTHATITVCNINDGWIPFQQKWDWFAGYFILTCRMFDKTTSPRKLFKVNHFWKHHLEMWKEGSKQPKKLMNTLLPHPGTYSLPCKEHQWLAAELPTMWGTGSVPMHTKMTWWRKVNVHKSKMVSLLDKKHNCEWGTQFILHFWADKYNNTLRNLTEST